MSARLRLEGKTINGVLFLNIDHVSKHQHSVWKCRCHCGNIFYASATAIRSGKQKGCGCGYKIHGLSKTSEHKIWDGIIQRCENPNAPAYKHYGGRGIKVCARWRNSFLNFYQDMGAKPDPKMTVDRINNDGDYCPENCRWSTRKQQCNNYRRNIFLEHSGVRLSISDWASKTGLNDATILYRIKHDWPIARALEEPTHVQHRRKV